MAGDHLEIVAGLLRQVDEVLVDDAAHAVMGAVDARRRCENLRASRTTPTSDWLMTAVGPPPWATRIFAGVMKHPLNSFL